MKAAELIHQEPFADRLTTTMSNFLELRFGGEWRVGWNDTVSRSTSQRWLVNLNINAVFRQGVHAETLEVVRREFGTSVIRWKRPLQRMYFWLATSGACGRLAHASLNVDPPVPEADYWLVVPGTHKIRFIDSRNSLVYCCRKSGCSPSHFARELEARRYALEQGVPVPPVVRTLSADCIAEPLITGTPLNRLLSREEQQQGFEAALHALEPLYRASGRTAEICSYASRILDAVGAHAGSAEAIASSRAYDLAKRLYLSLERCTDNVELVRAHGDFQPGNLLYDRGAIWLIDWEYSAERQREFDRMTYELRSRFDAGLTDRIAVYAGSCTNLPALDTLRLFLLETIHYECEHAALMKPSSVYRSLAGKVAAFEAALHLFPNGMVRR